MQMQRKGKSVAKKAGSAIARTARKVSAKLKPRKRAAKPKVAAAPARKVIKEPTAAPTARPVQRKTDVPLDLIAAMYSPRQTNMKTSFRSNGADQQNDQEIFLGEVDRWQDEDHFTNRSGDPRIGTHGRSYEPGEK
jgi:hypothetical protein